MRSSGELPDQLLSSRVGNGGDPFREVKASIAHRYEQTVKHRIRSPWLGGKLLGESRFSALIHNQQQISTGAIKISCGESRDEGAESKISAPFPGDFPVVDPKTDKPIRGVQFQLEVMRKWSSKYRAAFVAATGASIDLDRTSAVFVCACHFRIDDLVKGHRGGSYVMAEDKLPRTPMQLAQDRPPARPLPWTRALTDGTRRLSAR